MKKIKKRISKSNFNLVQGTNPNGKIKNFLDFETEKLYTWEDRITAEELSSFIKNLDAQRNATTA